MYHGYFRNQVPRSHQRGGGCDMPNFVARYQRGHGLGSIFGTIFQGLRVIMSSIFKTVGKHALNTDVNITTKWSVIKLEKTQVSMKWRLLS
jgi:hypothetical protein